MLVALYLSRGLAALKSIFVLTAGASTSWYSQYLDSPTIGPGPLIMTLAYVLWTPVPSVAVPDEPLEELSQLLESPTLDLVLFHTLALEPEPTKSSALPSARVTPPVPESTSLPLQHDSTSTSQPPVIVEVPELDWTTPGAATLRPSKVEEGWPDVIFYDLWVTIVVWAPLNSTFWQPLPGPIIPDDVVPMRQYQAPELLFDKICRTKGPHDEDFRSSKDLSILAIRALVLLVSMALGESVDVDANRTASTIVIHTTGVRSGPSVFPCTPYAH
ncbi:hypothetical protein EVJ58_g10622 [Rhodofomes roseus]|uniref:Uncharacterized protein n=1 Tax=Rhodofomes roseus TaxID=34475 RepID=A0A4Y9XS33_9APHY|nr:hypothetical protein EVJ58_g10622 [Rhodofomes roseus]